MTRRLIILVYLTLFLAPALSVARDIGALESALGTARGELAKTQEQLATQRRAADKLADELAALNAAAPELEQARAAAREAMDARYQRIIADPMLDLGSALVNYREAMEAVARQTAASQAKERAISDQRERIARTERATQSAAEQVTEARATFDRARVARLEKELNAVGEITLSHSRRCEPDETIAGCIERTQEAARDLAKQRFVDQVFAAATEADAIAEARDGAGLEVTLIESRVANGQFKGQGDYDVEITAKIAQRVGAEAVCTLLRLSADQCAGAPAPAPAPAIPAASSETSDPSAGDAAPEGVPGDGDHVLTVRSNAYYDEVFIDGVAYGSTKVAVNLPSGEYDVEVRKPGHRSWRQRIRLDRDRTVVAELSEP